MDSHRLARTAVNLIVSSRAHGPGDPAADRVCRLVVSKLPGALTAVDANALDARSHARLTDAVAGEVAADPGFAQSLARALNQAQFTDNSGQFNGAHVQGGIHNSKFRNTKIRIGRFQIGTGGLVSGVAALVVLGGGAAVVLPKVTDQVAVSEAVGRWELSGSTPMAGFQTKPTVLTVTPDGKFTFSLGMSMSAPGDLPAGVNAPSIDVECGGTVSPDGDHFTLRSTAGACGTFTARPTADGTIMDVLLTDGSADGSLPLTKVG
jgi:hypothetical protein